MAITPGKIQLESDGYQYDVAPPLYGYTTTIELPFDYQQNQDGALFVYDHGADYDKRYCDCKFILDNTDSFWLSTFIKLYVELAPSQWNFGSIYLRGESGNGFFPFGADKGDIGDFQIKLYYNDIACIVNKQYNLPEFNLRIYNDGAYPSYTFVSDTTYNGGGTIGTITNIRYPQDWYSNVKKAPFTFIQQLEGGLQQVFKIKYGQQHYTTEFDLVCDTAKAQRLIDYFTNTIRGSTFSINSEFALNLFGYDFASDIAQFCTGIRLFQDKIIITHESSNRFRITLKFYGFYSEV